MDIAGYEPKKPLFLNKQAKLLAGEIYRHIRGVPVSLDGTVRTIQEIGVGLFEFHGIPRNT
jgi:hypothetical protein